MKKLTFALKAVLLFVFSIYLFNSCASNTAAEISADRHGKEDSKEEKKEKDLAETADLLPGARGEEMTEVDSLFSESVSEDKVKIKELPWSSTPAKSGLQAGYADDNKQFNYFLNFLNEYINVEHINIDISERIKINIFDSSKKSIPNADIRIYGDDNLLLKRKSYADGSFLFFPSEYDTISDFTVEITYMQQTKIVNIDKKGKREIDIVFDLLREEKKNIPLDLLFILDTTGSMGEEIHRLKATIEIINMNLLSLPSKPEVRFGMVLYKDRGDEEYITKIIPLTSDIASFQEELKKVYADGGNDIREDLQAALDDAVRKIRWNKDGIRLGFIVTDAPPHLDYNQEYTYADAVKDAGSAGIKIFSVGTGGLAVDGEYILRQISQYTYAKYIFLTYGENEESEGGIQGSVSHHTGSNFQTDKLEAIIIRFAKDELQFLTDQPLVKDDEYFSAVSTDDEKKEETLNKLFNMAVSQLVDYSSIKIENGTGTSIIPVISMDDKHEVDAEYFTDQLAGSVSKNEVFKILERGDLQKILKELELQLSGLVNDESAVKVGEFLGAQVLLTGKLYSTKDEYEIFLKLLRVETAEVLSVTKAVIDKKLGISGE